MQTSASAEPDYFSREIRQLFFQRTLICLWLGAIFFSLFAVLDFMCCREQFSLFLTYRLSFVVILLLFLVLLRFPALARFAPPLMYASLLLGTLTISLMTVRLGGFYSGYYVGILLMIAGGFSVLPLRVFEALLIGGAMYLVYVVTVLVGAGLEDNTQITYAVNNTFFFLSLVGVTAAQCLDDLRTHRNEIRAKKSIQTMRRQLSAYTDNLEYLVQQRLTQLEEADLKYRDLYNNILDLVVLMDGDGVVTKINERCSVLLGRSPGELEGTDFAALLAPQTDAGEAPAELLAALRDGDNVEGVQLRLADAAGDELEVEVSGSRVEIDGRHYHQLILRDISATKKMERQILDSERLTDTSRQAAIFGLARLVECRDDDTGAHLTRIRTYTRILAEELAQTDKYGELVTEGFISDLLRSSVLHDIGKIGIPDAVLLKADKLTEAEFECIKQHCIFGSDTLHEAEAETKHASFLHMGQEIARFHHERWDGTGYPEGRAGTDIPLAARIVALADVYDALTSRRSYKPAYHHEQAREVIIAESGAQFDPDIVNAFLRREGDFRESRMRLLFQDSRQPT